MDEVNQGFTWKYLYRNLDPIDEPFEAYWGENVPVAVLARLECGEASFFVHCRNNLTD